MYNHTDEELNVIFKECGFPLMTEKEDFEIEVTTLVFEDEFKTERVG